MANLNTAQLTTLKTWAQARLAENNQQDENQLAALANVVVNPDYFVWRTSLGKHELMEDPGIGDNGVTVTNFVWGGSQSGNFIDRSPGELNAFRELFNTLLICKPHLPAIRIAFDDISSGAGAGAQANRAHFRAKARRSCTTGEKLYVIQTVGGPTQTGNRGTRTNPDTLVVEGPFTAQNIIDALNQA